MAAFDVGGIAVVCNTLRSQCKSLDCFTHVGVEPAAKKVVVVKSMQHFHAAYAPVASEILYVAVPGAVAPDFLTHALCQGLEAAMAVHRRSVRGKMKLPRATAHSDNPEWKPRKLFRARDDAR